MKHNLAFHSDIKLSEHCEAPLYTINCCHADINCAVIQVSCKTAYIGILKS